MWKSPFDLKSNPSVIGRIVTATITLVTVLIVEPGQAINDGTAAAHGPPVDVVPGAGTTQAALRRTLPGVPEGTTRPLVAAPACFPAEVACARRRAARLARASVGSSRVIPCTRLKRAWSFVIPTSAPRCAPRLALRRRLAAAALRVRRELPCTRSTEARSASIRSSGASSSGSAAWCTSLPCTFARTTFRSPAVYVSLYFFGCHLPEKAEIRSSAISSSGSARSADDPA